MPEYEEYIQRYIRNRNITPEEAKQHAIAQSVKRYYEEPDRTENVWW